MQRGSRPHDRQGALLRATLILAGIYVLGRIVLPLAGARTVDTWRLSVGVALFVAAGALLLMAARRTPALRSGWVLLAVGVLVYPVGTVTTEWLGTPQSAPPIAHAAWLSFYVCALLGIGRLAHALVRPFPAAFLLDGVAAILALGSAISLLAAAGGAEPYRLWEAALGLAYPALDLVLLGFTAWIMSATRAAPAALWRRLAATWALLLACDAMFVALGAAQQLSDIAPYTVGYPIVMVLLARAAQQPAPEVAELEPDTRTVVALPVAAALTMLAVLVAVAVTPTAGPTVPLVALGGVVLGVRVILIQRAMVGLAEARRFERGFDEAGIGMGITDLDGRWIRVNQALADLLGRPAQTLLGRDALEAVEGDRAHVIRQLRAQLAQGTAVVGEVQVRIAVPGDTRDLLVTSDLVRGNDGPQCFAQIRDVTAERRAAVHAGAISSISREALALDRLDVLLSRVVPTIASAIDAELVAWLPMGAGVPVCEPHAGRLGHALLDDLRAGASVIAGGHARPGVEIDDARAIELGLPNLGQQGVEYVSFTPVAPRAADRAVLCVAHRRVPDARPELRTFLDTVANVLATAADRTHEEQASRHRALHDPLTGLANRALLNAHLGQAIASARRDDGEVGVLLLDLDRFKLVNDTLGHEIGDGLLCAVADRLARHTREGELLARLGGDEFVLVVSHVRHADEMEHAAERIVSALHEPFSIGARELSVGASAGVAVRPASAASAAALLREADQAMYRAKRGGGARWSRGTSAAATDASARESR